MGSTTQIVISSILHVNGVKASLKVLKNVKVVISTENYIEKIPVNKIFTGLKFDND